MWKYIDTDFIQDMERIPRTGITFDNTLILVTSDFSLLRKIPVGHTWELLNLVHSRSECMKVWHLEHSDSVTWAKA